MSNPIQQYEGEQILISSGRLVFNTDADHMLFSTAGRSHFSVKEAFLIDVGEKGSVDKKYKFQVNAPLIQFGSNRLGRTVEPVVKANSLEILMKDLFIALNNYSKAVAASVPDQSLLLQEASNLLRTQLNKILYDINSMKSDTTFTI